MQALGTFLGAKSENAFSNRSRADLIILFSETRSKSIFSADERRGARRLLTASHRMLRDEDKDGAIEGGSQPAYLNWEPAFLNREQDARGHRDDSDELLLGSPDPNAGDQSHMRDFPDYRKYGNSRAEAVPEYGDVRSDRRQPEASDPNFVTGAGSKSSTGSRDEFRQRQHSREDTGLWDQIAEPKHNHTFDEMKPHSPELRSQQQAEDKAERSRGRDRSSGGNSTSSNQVCSKLTLFIARPYVMASRHLGWHKRSLTLERSLSNLLSCM